MHRFRLAVNSLQLWNHPADQAVNLAAGYGFSGIEIWVEQIRFYDTPLSKIANAVHEHNMRLTIHAPSWDLNLCALNQRMRRQSLVEVCDAIHITHDLGAADLTVHPGQAALPEPWQSFHLDIMVESFQYLAEQAHRSGVTLSVELMEKEKGQLITAPAQLNSLLAKLSHPVHTTLDVAHLSSEADLEQALSALQRINKIHFSNRSDSQYHLPLGMGIFDCRRLLKKLSATGLPIVLEGFDASNDHSLIHANLEFINAHSDLAELLEEVEPTAQKSLRR